MDVLCAVSPDFAAGRCIACESGSIFRTRPASISTTNMEQCYDWVNASAKLYRLIETVKANRFAPKTYLKMMFTELSNATSLEEIEALLRLRQNTRADFRWVRPT